MNYHIKDVGGKDRDFAFNMAAVDEYWRRLVFGAIEASAIYASFYAGLIGSAVIKAGLAGACIVKCEQMDFDYTQSCKWVDELYKTGRKNEIKIVCDRFAETDEYKMVLAEKLETLKELEKKEDKSVKKKRT